MVWERCNLVILCDPFLSGYSIKIDKTNTAHVLMDLPVTSAYIGVLMILDGFSPMVNIHLLHLRPEIIFPDQFSLYIKRYFARNINGLTGTGDDNMSVTVGYNKLWRVDKIFADLFS